ncbi:MAG: carbohydrate ABC transporter permease [Massiliimalia sp.]
MNHPNYLRRWIFPAARHVLLLAASAVVLFPFLWMVFASFKPAEDIFQDTFHLLPTTWEFGNFSAAWNAAPFDKFFINSVAAAVLSVTGQVVTCTLAAYGFAKLNFWGKKVFFTLLLACMMIPDEAAIIPNFLFAKNLNLLDTWLGLSLTSLTSVFGIFLLRQTFLSIPNDLLYAAKIDGCNELGSFFHIALPCAGSSIATVVLLAFLDSWNAYMWPMVVTYQNTTRTLQIGLKYLIKPDLGPQWPMIMAASTLILLPVLLLFVGLQHYFVEGMVKTGIK